MSQVHSKSLVLLSQQVTTLQYFFVSLDLMTSVDMNNKDAQVELFPEVMMVLSTDIILTSSESNLQEKSLIGRSQ